MKKIALALACATMVGVTAPVPVEAQSGRILKSLDTQDLERAMSEIGGTATLDEPLDDGDPTMKLEFSNGLIAVAEFNCNEVDGCTGLNLIAYFTRDESMSIAEAEQMTREFDWGRAAVSSGVDDRDNMFVGRYLILDHGIAYDNLVLNLQVFEALSGEFGGY